MFEVSFYNMVFSRIVAPSRLPARERSVVVTAAASHRHGFLLVNVASPWQLLEPEVLPNTIVCLSLTSQVLRACPVRPVLALVPVGGHPT